MELKAMLQHTENINREIQVIKQTYIEIIDPTRTKTQEKEFGRGTQVPFEGKIRGHYSIYKASLSMKS